MKLRLFAIFLACANHLGAAEQKPNIVMLLIDDMGWGDFSCFGNMEAKTPNIDRMASEGIRFSQFYVNAPICSPSRCAIITGQYPQRWRITSFLNNRAENNRRGMAQWLDPKAPSLARTLQQNGYATGHFGKWHLGGQRNVDNAPAITEYGYDETLTNFEGMGPKLLPLTLKPGDTTPGRIWEEAVRLGGPVTWMQRSEITSGYINKALPFIDKAVEAKKPFYINLWPDDVHSPFWPPTDKWANGKHGLYLSVLQEMDKQLGKIFDHIRDNPALRDNTLIVIYSDNGPEPGAGSAGPFRGKKGGLYEGGTRSSLIVWGPGLVDKAKAGTHNATSVFAAMDLAPSLLDIAHVAAPADIKYDGMNLSPVLLGKSEDSHKGPICWRRPPDRPRWSPIQGKDEALPDLSIRLGDWKLLCTYTGTEPQLYDLANDRWENTNLAAKNADKVEELTKLVLDWHKSMPPDNGPSILQEKADPAGGN